MDALTSIEDEVNRQVDGQLERVLVKLVDNLLTTLLNGCEQKLALISYVRAKITTHRLKRAIDRNWVKYDEEVRYRLYVAQQTAKALRRAYYGSECFCGSCRSRNENRRLNVLGSAAGG